VRLPTRWAKLLLLTTGWLTLTICITFMLVDGIVRHRSEELGPGILAPFSWVMAIIMARSLLPTVLTATELRYPRALWGNHVIPLAEIIGVGLRYTSDSREGWAWSLMVWERDKKFPLGVPICRRGAPRRAGHRIYTKHRIPRAGLPAKVVLVPAEIDWAYLAASKPGRVALLINEWVLAVQGPDGLLAAKRMEVNTDSGYGDYTAYWSPDSRCGKLDLPTTL
jgi:hypothetical protein